jgi:hypothetical protein
MVVFYRENYYEKSCNNNLFWIVCVRSRCMGMRGLVGALDNPQWRFAKQLGASARL